MVNILCRAAASPERRCRPVKPVATVTGTDIMAHSATINEKGREDGSQHRKLRKAKQKDEQFTVGIDRKNSTKRHDLISELDRCIQLNGMQKPTMNSIHRQTNRI